MNKFILITCLLLVTSAMHAQKYAVPNAMYKTLQSRFDSEQAYSTVSFVEQRWRLAGNPHFDECIYYVEDILKKAGFKNESVANASDILTYRIEKRKLRRPSWQPIEGSITLEGESTPLLSLHTNKNMLAINSASTSKEGDYGEIINIGNGSDADISGKDLSNKILFGMGSVRSLHGLALKHKALGILTYSIPAYNQPEKFKSSISFGSMPYLDSLKNKWCIFLSYDAKEKLIQALTKGIIKARVKINTQFYTNDELTLIADVKGSANANERFVYSAHVQDPGANDNASGVGALAEMARVTANMVIDKKYLPQRSITFLWGDEIISTRRYIEDDTIRKKGILWGLSLDMVGEDTKKTGGTFLIEKMPDPSAIWTRGNDKHTEWGGRPLKESDLFPHYFNNLLLSRCKQQAAFNNWVVNTNPFEGGSDHTPFLDAKIPGLLMWHFTDVYYHVDGDRLDKVSKEELENVGVSALATAYILCKNNMRTTLSVIKEIKQSAVERLNAEKILSTNAIKSGANTKDQNHIIDTWKSYYIHVMNTTKEIHCMGTDKRIDKLIERCKKEISIL